MYCKFSLLTTGACMSLPINNRTHTSHVPKPSEKHVVGKEKGRTHSRFVNSASPAVPQGRITVPLEVISERSLRIINAASSNKSFHLTNKEIQILETSLAKPSVMRNFEDFQKFSKVLIAEVKKSMCEGVRKEESEGINKRAADVGVFLNRVLDKVKKIGFKAPKKEIQAKGKAEAAKPAIAGQVAAEEHDKKAAAGLDAYERGEIIPKYIHDLEIDIEHTIPTADYLENRISNITIQSIFKSAETSIFIGSPNDMGEFYKSKGYRCIGQLVSPSSTPFYYFEHNDKPGVHAVVICGITNESRFNHQLLQLKYAGVDLDTIKVRGHFKAYLDENNGALKKVLDTLQPPPEISFIGNRALPMIGLADRLYPDQMPPKNEREEVREKKAEELLMKYHQMKTFEIGPYKFSYAVAKVNGKDAGILAMRMPNGDLAGHATEMILKSGTKNLIMVGAGGSFSSQAAQVGDYQVLIESQRNEASTKIGSEELLKPNLKGCKVYEKGKNVTVDSPLVETQHWLKQNIANNQTSVDVESFHIIQAFKKFGAGKHILSGVFTSDVLGEHPLVEKINLENAYSTMPHFLQGNYDLLKVQGPVVPIQVSKEKILTEVEGLIDKLKLASKGQINLNTIPGILDQIANRKNQVTQEDIKSLDALLPDFEGIAKEKGLGNFREQYLILMKKLKG